MADRLSLPLAFLDKRRPEPGVAEVLNVVGDVSGKTAILFDDMIDSAGTICSAAEALKHKGAKAVYACCTHPVFSGPAVERLQDAPLEEVVVTDTIPLRPEQRTDKIKILSVAPLLGEAVIRVNEHLSVSKLFDS